MIFTWSFPIVTVTIIVRSKTDKKVNQDIFDIPETMLLTSGALLLSLEVEGRLEAACRPLAPLPPPPPAPPLPLKKKGAPEEVPLSPMAEGGRGLVEAEKGSGSVERE